MKGAYLIKCVGYETDDEGNVTEIAAEYDPESRGGNPADGRKVKGATIHWVDAATAVDAEVRLYDNLFSDPEPESQVFGGLDRVQGGGGAVGGSAVGPVPVHAAGVFLRRQQGFQAGAPSVQPGGELEGQL